MTYLLLLLILLDYVFKLVIHELPNSIHGTGNLVKSLDNRITLYSVDQLCNILIGHYHSPLLKFTSLINKEACVPKGFPHFSLKLFNRFLHMLNYFMPILLLCQTAPLIIIKSHTLRNVSVGVFHTVVELSEDKGDLEVSHLLKYFTQKVKRTEFKSTRTHIKEHDWKQVVSMVHDVLLHLFDYECIILTGHVNQRVITTRFVVLSGQSDYYFAYYFIDALTFLELSLLLLVLFYYQL